MRFGLRGGPHRLEGGGGDRGGIAGLEREAQRAALDARQVDQVLDELALGERVPEDRVEGFAGGLLVDAFVAQDVGPADDRVQRRA
jgi:hypothetical protein